MRRLLAVVVCGLSMVSCGGPDRLSLWRVAVSQPVSAAECFSNPRTQVITSDLLGFSTWELWEGEGNRRLLAAWNNGVAFGYGAHECTLAGARLTCTATQRQAFNFDLGSPETSSTLTHTTVSTINATISGDLMSGEARSILSHTCEGNCSSTTLDPECTTTSSFTGFRVRADLTHPI